MYTERQGYVQVYTGDGKGKTTAALGLTLRAAGAGLKVLFAQFIKGGEYSEIKALERYADLVTLKQYGRSRFIRGKPDPEDIKAAQAGLKEVRGYLADGTFDVVVLDEANGAVNAELFSIEDLLALVDSRPADVELVITGRKAHANLIAKANLVTEMQAVKHYYEQGVQARVGIEK